MRRLTRIVYENWGCYEHVDITLDAKIYAVVARHVSDPERSNWLGKSMFVGGVKFGLSGDHEARTEKGWIRRGAKSGSVELHFDDGCIITRKRTLLTSTQLEFQRPGEPLAKGDAAQAIIDRMIGLSAIDRDATCFLEQGMMSRLMKMVPSKRLEIIASWFRLNELRACSEDVGSTTASLSWRASQIETNLRMVRDTIVREVGESENLEGLEALITKTKEKIELAEGTLASAQDTLQKNATRVAAKDVVQDYERVEREGKALRKETDALGKLTDLQALYTERQKRTIELRAKQRVAEGNLRTKRTVAAGKFDGKCPVADITCPATTLINSQRVVNGKAVHEAEASLMQASEAADKAARIEKRALAAYQESERKHERLEHLRQELKRLFPKYRRGVKLEAVEDETVLRARVDSANTRLVDLKSKLGSYERSHVLVLRAREEERKLATELERVEVELTTHREGLAFFKALQRRVAERSLSQIELGANAVLSESGIDLGLKLEWSREGEGSAKSCETCGHPFPKSEKVKACERCGTPRGANIIEKLEPVLTNRSGGALDLAGLALQLSASRWLRDDRMSVWSTAFIDEPYGALDAANRRALSSHIAGMLRGRYGFEQAFLIAHHSSVLDALPGRIEITARGSREQIVSTARVVA